MIFVVCDLLSLLEREHRSIVCMHGPRMADLRFEPDRIQTKDYKFIICCWSTDHQRVRTKTGWLEI